MCCCQRVNSVAEQAQSACPMGQPISHPTKSGFSRRRDRPFRIRRETARPCEAIIEAQSGREIGACGKDRGPSGEVAGAGQIAGAGRALDVVARGGAVAHPLAHAYRRILVVGGEADGTRLRSSELIRR